MRKRRRRMKRIGGMRMMKRRMRMRRMRMRRMRMRRMGKHMKLAGRLADLGSPNGVEMGPGWI